MRVHGPPVLHAHREVQSVYSGLAANRATDSIDFDVGGFGHDDTDVLTISTTALSTA